MPTKDSFPVLFEDEHLIAINKPTHILVHRTNISEDTRFVLQILRKQIGQRVYPVHRLDRATSGVLLFGKNSEITEKVSSVFRHRQVEKIYWGIVRGYLDKQGEIDYPLAKEKWLPKKEAVSYYRLLDQTELPVAIGPYPTARYSWVEIQLETGRRHQIRRHFAHLRHPIIGDKKYGDVKHNNYWRDYFGIDRMLLHACRIRLQHPESKTLLDIEAPLDEAFRKSMNLLGFSG